MSPEDHDREGAGSSDEELLGQLSLDKGIKWEESDERRRRQAVAERAKEKHTERMGALLERDIKQVLFFRPAVALFFAMLLMAQNGAVYHIVVASSELKVDSTFLSVLITGTLVETYGIAHVIVQFLFKEKDYTPNHERKHP